MKEKIKSWFVLEIIAWTAFFVVTGSIYYVNHYLPHGPSYPTGEYSCLNDDRGPCGEIYVEDLRSLDIPGWAKFFKSSSGELLWIGLAIVGILATAKAKYPSK